jgi:hypothetical protein
MYFDTGINFAPTVHPIDRFENTMFLDVSSGWYICCLGVTAVYSSIFATAWNYSFPTIIERNLWRAASLSILGSLFAFIAVTEMTFTVYPTLQKAVFCKLFPKAASKDEAKGHERSRLARMVHRLAGSVRNNSPLKDPALTVPLKAILPLYIVAVFYCTSRMYILLADMIELRSLPTSAYKTVNWSSFVPHL